LLSISDLRVDDQIESKKKESTMKKILKNIKFIFSKFFLI